MNTTMAVAETIKEQIGGGALFMLGARGTLMGDASSLSFRVKGSNKVTHVKVILAADDTYTVEAFKVRGRSIAPAGRLEMVYADQLRDVLATLTGLAVSL